MRALDINGNAVIAVCHKSRLHNAAVGPWQQIIPSTETAHAMDQGTTNYKQVSLVTSNLETDTIITNLYRDDTAVTAEITAATSDINAVLQPLFHGTGRDRPQIGL